MSSSRPLAITVGVKRAAAGCGTMVAGRSARGPGVDGCPAGSRAAGACSSSSHSAATADASSDAHTGDSATAASADGFSEVAVASVDHEPVVATVTTASASKGDGIAKKDGFVIFVKGARQGDTVKVRITDVRERFSTGEIIQ